MDKKTHDVVELLSKRQLQLINDNRKIMSSIVKTVIMCGRQGLPLRGHRDDSQFYGRPEHNPGNFQVFLEARVDAGDSQLQHDSRLIVIKDSRYK